MFFGAEKPEDLRYCHECGYRGKLTFDPQYSGVVTCPECKQVYTFERKPETGLLHLGYALRPLMEGGK